MIKLGEIYQDAKDNKGVKTIFIRMFQHDPTKDGKYFWDLEAMVWRGVKWRPLSITHCNSLEELHKKYFETSETLLDPKDDPYERMVPEEADALGYKVEHSKKLENEEEELNEALDKAFEKLSGPSKQDLF